MRTICDPAAIEPYLSDESNAFKALPETVSKVFFPESLEHLTSVLRGASAEGIRCTVSGAGTGLTGSRVPMSGGYVISMERMLKVDVPSGWEMIERQFPAGTAGIAVSRSEMLARVPPGITLDMLTEMLPDGLFYPPDPTESTAQLGGTAATNGSGSRTFYFGSTRDWIVGLTVALPNGDALRVRRGRILADDDHCIRFASDSGERYDVPCPTYQTPRVKNAAGLYAAPGMDLCDLFIGCEGILGVFAELEIKLAEKPAGLIADVAFFGSEANALGYTDEVRELRLKGIIAIEYFDSNSLAVMREKELRIKENYYAAVLVEALGDRDDVIDAIFESCERHGVLDDWSGPPEQFREFRHSLPEAVNSYVKQQHSYKLATDFAVPAAGFGEIMRGYREADEMFRKAFPRAGVHTVLFGHLGDYHLHFNFMTHNEVEMAFAKRLYVKLARKAVELGGTVSAEHGVGKKTVELDGRSVPYLQLMFGKDGLRQIAAVKRALDRKLILNVGNMLPEARF
ncbi:MAG: FAD-binding oxidoreductase [Candidatus Coatesbacteria bacterium]|nr:FAD-binding oxidoreductase [Candidatus Coatesbacteria bacterium]